MTERDTTKLLPGGFYFTNERHKGRNLYRALDGRLFTMYCGRRTYIDNEGADCG
jgi:hypothetical protein